MDAGGAKGGAAGQDARQAGERANRRAVRSQARQRAPTRGNADATRTTEKIRGQTPPKQGQAAAKTAAHERGAPAWLVCGVRRRQRARRGSHDKGRSRRFIMGTVSE